MAKDLIVNLKLENAEYKRKIKAMQAELDHVKKSAQQVANVKLGGGFSKAINSASTALSGMSGGISGVMSSLGGLASAAGPYGIAIGTIATGFGAVASKAIDARKEIENLENNFGTLLGSQDAGTEMVNQIKAYGQQTSYDTAGVANAAQVMLAYGVAAEDLMPTMKQLGDIALGDNQHLASLGLAFGQMSAAGKVTKQDLNQMANAGFGFGEIAKSMGISVAEFQERLGKGQVSLNDVQKALQDATSAGGKFYNGAKNGMNGLAGASANVDDAMNNTLASFGKMIEPAVVSFMNGLADVIEDVGKVLVEIQTPGTELNDIFNTMCDISESVWNTFKDLIKTLWDATEPFRDLLFQITELIMDLYGVKRGANEGSAGVSGFTKAINISLIPLKAAIALVNKLIEGYRKLKKWAGDKLGIKWGNDDNYNTGNKPKHKKPTPTTKTPTGNKTPTGTPPKNPGKGDGHKHEDPIKKADSEYAEAVRIANLKKELGLYSDKLGYENDIADALKSQIDAYTKVPKLTASQNQKLVSKVKLYKKLESENKSSKIDSDYEQAMQKKNDFYMLEILSNKSITADKAYQLDLLKQQINSYIEINDKTEEQKAKLKSLFELYGNIVDEVDEYNKKLKKNEERDTDRNSIYKFINDFNNRPESISTSINPNLIGSGTKSDKTKDNLNSLIEQYDQLSRKLAEYKEEYKDIQDFGIPDTFFISSMNEQLDALKANIKDTANQLQKDLMFENALSAFNNIGTIADNVRSIGTAFDDVNNALDGFIAAISAITTLMQTYQTIMAVVNTINALFGATTVSNAAAQTSATAAQTSKATSDVAATATAAAVTTANKLQTASYMDLAAAEYMAAHAAIPFVGATIGAGMITSMLTAMAGAKAASATMMAFANGGIVGGNMYSGDRNLVRVNSGEMILNGSQQSKLFNLLDSPGMNNGYGVSTVKVKGSDLYLALSNYNKIGSKTNNGIRF